MTYKFPVVDGGSSLCYYARNNLVGKAYCELGLSMTYHQIKETIRGSHYYLIQLRQNKDDFWKTDNFDDCDKIVLYNVEFTREYFLELLNDNITDNEFMTFLEGD